jgi:hypothetical protein
MGPVTIPGNMNPVFCKGSPGSIAADAAAAIMTKAPRTMAPLTKEFEKLRMESLLV